MLNELARQLRNLLPDGKTLICAVSGGADSMALLFGAYLLRGSLGFSLEAAHMNHGLRGAESDAEEEYVRTFCDRFDIPLLIRHEQIVAGEKGLEAAAREARYLFFSELNGMVATAHTANDNAETVLMHLVRGTGLKGLGGISPVYGNVIRPMLNITRQQVEAFLNEYHVAYRTDSSNHSDDFLRNRIRHHVMPLLYGENPRLAENLSEMAQRLRQDEQALAQMAQYENLPDVTALRGLPEAVCARMLEEFLKKAGVREPEAEHIALARKLVFSDKPSARGSFPGGVTIRRNYDRLEVCKEVLPLETVALPENGTVDLPDLGLRVVCCPAQDWAQSATVFTVHPQGNMVLRCRQSGDEMRLSGGRKSVKKLFVDRKIPAADRLQIPVVADEVGILGVYGIGANLDRVATELPAVTISFESIMK